MLLTDLKLNNYTASKDYQYSFVIFDLLGINNGKVYVIIITLKHDSKVNSTEVEPTPVEQTFTDLSKYMEGYFAAIAGGA